MNGTTNQDPEGMRKIANMIDISADDAQAFENMTTEQRLRSMGSDHAHRVMENRAAAVVVTDFTSVVCFQKDTFELIANLEPVVLLGRFDTKEEAEKAELAINIIMIEYRTKRNAWEKELAANAD